MIRKCTNTKHTDFHLYGGRGITYHTDFEDFGEFTSYIESLDSFNLPRVIINTRQGGLTLDRICNEGDYTYGNLRWADAKVQGENRRTSSNRVELLKVIPSLGWMDVNKGASACRDLGLHCSIEVYEELRDQLWVNGKPGTVKRDKLTEEGLTLTVMQLGWMSSKCGTETLRELKIQCGLSKYKRLRDEIWPEGKPSS